MSGVLPIYIPSISQFSVRWKHVIGTRTMQPTVCPYLVRIFEIVATDHERTYLDYWLCNFCHFIPLYHLLLLHAKLNSFCCWVNVIYWCEFAKEMSQPTPIQRHPVANSVKSILNRKTPRKEAVECVYEILI